MSRSEREQYNMFLGQEEAQYYDRALDFNMAPDVTKDNSVGGEPRQQLLFKLLFGRSGNKEVSNWTQRLTFSVTHGCKEKKSMLEVRSGRGPSG